MALNTKLTIVSTSKDGKTITVKDSTGIYNISTNPGGYGTPNPETSDLSRVEFYVESFGSSTTTHKTTFTSTTTPNITTITGGADVALIPALFGQSEPTARFEDGVLDISMLSILQEQTVNASLGSKEVSPNGGTFPLGIGGLIFDGIPYFVDATKANGSTIVYLIKNLPSTYTTAEPFYLATGHAFSNAGGKCCIATQTGRLVEDGCSTTTEDLLLKLLSYTLAAETAFSLKNYSKADALAERVKEICNSLNCGC